MAASFFNKQLFNNCSTIVWLWLTLYGFPHFSRLFYTVYSCIALYYVIVVWKCLVFHPCCQKYHDKLQSGLDRWPCGRRDQLPEISWVGWRILAKRPTEILSRQAQTFTGVFLHHAHRHRMRHRITIADSHAAMPLLLNLLNLPLLRIAPGAIWSLNTWAKQLLDMRSMRSRSHNPEVFSGQTQPVPAISKIRRHRKSIKEVTLTLARQ
jgi:hypothetical protein